MNRNQYDLEAIYPLVEEVKNTLLDRICNLNKVFYMSHC